MKPPTYDQINYAEALVERLRQANNIATPRYAKKVMECEDRAAMSRLIDEMKSVLSELER